MEKLAPPSSPMMSVPYTAEEALMSSIPGIPDAPDDVEDPPVPPGTTDVLPPTVPPLPDALVPLAHGFCQYLQAQLETRLDDAGRRLTKEVGATMDEMATYTKGVMAAYGPTPTPYQVTLRATSQEGFPVEVTMRKATAAELVEEMGRLVSWLVSNGYSSGAEAWRA